MADPKAPTDRPRARLGARPRFVALIAVVLVAAAGLVGCASGGGAGGASTSEEPESFTVGGCVRITVAPTVLHRNPNGENVTSQTEYGPARCDSGDAYAKITKMGAENTVVNPANTQSTEDLDCPDDTDEFATVKSSLGIQTRAACLRKLTAPHPGDPGQGGGVVRSGDCLQVYDSYGDNVDEVPCTTRDWIEDGVTLGKEWFGQVVGRATAVTGCPASTVFTITIQSGVHPVLCLAKNGGWLPAAGDCVDANTFTRTASRRNCADRHLALKITALVAAGQACPDGVTPRKVPGYVPEVCLHAVG